MPTYQGPAMFTYRYFNKQMCLNNRTGNRKPVGPKEGRNYVGNNILNIIRIYSYSNSCFDITSGSCVK